MEAKINISVFSVSKMKQFTVHNTPHFYVLQDPLIDVTEDGKNVINISVCTQNLVSYNREISV